VSSRHDVADEGAEVSEESLVIWVEAGECPERAYFCALVGAV
jgi:hypothetical protein